MPEAALLSAVSSRAADIVINEIMYHPAPSVPENAGQEWIELFNAGAATVDLHGWRIAAGVRYTFTNQTLPPGGYLVVASSLPAFRSRYPGVTNVVGGWEGTLSNNGEEIRLVDASGQTVASVAYASEGDWATRVRGPFASGHYGWVWFTEANGGGKSLELLHPSLPMQLGQSWAASTVANGTPGRTNSVLTAAVAPAFLDVLHSPAIPTSADPVTVTARLSGGLPEGGTASLFYRVDAVPTNRFVEVPMSDDGLHGDGVAQDRIFGAVLPAQPAGAVVEFYVRAVGFGGRSRTWPAAARQVDGSFAQTANLLYQVDENGSEGPQQILRLVLTESERAELASGTIRQTDAEMNGTLISVSGTGTKVRYNVGARIRGAGSRGNSIPNYRINFPADNRWNGVSAINLNAAYPYLQAAGAAFLQKAGLTAANGQLVQVRVNGLNLANSGFPQYGAYSLMEAFGSEWVANHYPLDSAGNLYRASTGSHSATLANLGTNYLSYVSSGYDKASNASQNDWSDLFALVAALNAPGSDADYAAAVRRVADVEEWMRYFAAFSLLTSMETSLATGRGDDYSIYSGILDPRMRLLPHDLDTILGDGDTGSDPATSLFRMVPEVNPGANTTVLNRFMRHPDFVPIYFRALKQMIETSFSAEQLDPLLDRVLSGAVPDSTLSGLKSFAAARRAAVLNLIPLSLSATTPLSVSNGLPRTAFPTITVNGRANAIETRSIRVNGRLATWTPWLGNWTATSVPVLPGLNAVLVQTFDAASRELARTTIDVWYDDGTVQSVAGLLGTTNWTAADGPYLVTSSVTIPAGDTLTIQPGTTVYFAPGAGLTVANGGRLLAEGTDAARIRFTRPPGSGGNWTGITIQGSGGSPETRLGYVHFDGNGSTAVHVTDGTVFLDHLKFGNTSVQYVSLDRASFDVQDCLFPATSGSFEPVHGTGGIKAGGRGIFQRNFWGKVQGYNDALDFTGGNRPGPILQILNNVFMGTDDDLIDLDSTDAWVEGNLFLHAHRNGAPDSASAVSGGADNADTSEITIVGNLFFDIDQAANAKQGNFYTFLHNTVVEQNHRGSQDPVTGLIILADDGTVPGRGFYLEGNIFSGVELMVRNPSNAQVTFTNNIVHRLAGAPWSGPGGLNATNDPAFVHLPTLEETLGFTTHAQAQVMWEWLRLRPGSPAIGAGPDGRDLGAVPAAGSPLRGSRGVSLSGEPDGVTTATTARLQVGFNRVGGGIQSAGFPDGSGFTRYLWRLDGGAWSAETPVSTPILLSGLSPGLHQVEAAGRNDAGFYQNDPIFGADATTTLSKTWRVDDGQPPALRWLRLSEVLARNETAVPVGDGFPDLVELHNAGPIPADLGGCGLSDDPLAPLKFLFPAGTLLGPGEYLVVQADAGNGPGVHLGFGLKQDGLAKDASKADQDGSQTWYEHQNMRDDRVEAFASLLWEGVHAYVYVARATTAGTFTAPPPKAEEMYAPETFGRGAGDRVIIAE